MEEKEGSADVTFETLMEEKEASIAALRGQCASAREAAELYEGSETARMMVEMYEDVLHDLVYEMAVEAHRETEMERLQHERKEDDERNVRCEGGTSRTRTPNGSGVHCECPNCLRVVAAGRFTLHLVKCMTQTGAGRGAKESARKRSGAGDSRKQAKLISDNESSDGSEYEGYGRKAKRRRKQKR